MQSCWLCHKVPSYCKNGLKCEPWFWSGSWNTSPSSEKPLISSLAMNTRQNLGTTFMSIWLSPLIHPQWTVILSVSFRNWLWNMLWKSLGRWGFRAWLTWDWWNICMIIMIWCVLLWWSFLTGEMHDVWCVLDLEMAPKKLFWNRLNA